MSEKHVSFDLRPIHTKSAESQEKKSLQPQQIFERQFNCKTPRPSLFKPPCEKFLNHQNSNTFSSQTGNQSPFDFSRTDITRCNQSNLFQSRNDSFVGLGSYRVYPAVHESLFQSSNKPNLRFLQNEQVEYQCISAFQPILQNTFNFPQNQLNNDFDNCHEVKSIDNHVFKMIQNPYERFSLSDIPQSNKIYNYRISTSAFDFNLNSSLPRPSRYQQSFMRVKADDPKKTLFNGLEAHDESLANKFSLKPSSSPKRLIIKKNI